MYSQLVPFQSVIEAVKDGTGFRQITNLYPQIRRFINRIHGELGYGSSLIMKKITYSTELGNILVDSYGNQRIRMPEDLIKVEAYGTCELGLCPGSYNIQGNYLFLCSKVEEFKLVYYALLCDGKGNPAVSENHFEAVVAGILFNLYKPKMWNKEGNLNFYQKLEQDYYNSIGEAIGNEVFPSTEDEWAHIAQKLSMSRFDIMVYDSARKCYSCVPDSAVNNDPDAPVVIPPTSTPKFVYYWQYDNILDNINVAPTIDQDFLDTKPVDPISAFTAGKIVSYSEIGRIAFAIKGIQEGAYKIRDLFNSDITETTFDSYYNAGLQTQIFISKEYYSFGNIYFKFTTN